MEVLYASNIASSSPSTTAIKTAAAVNGLTNLTRMLSASKQHALASPTPTASATAAPAHSCSTQALFYVNSNAPLPQPPAQNKITESSTKKGSKLKFPKLVKAALKNSKTIKQRNDFIAFSSEPILKSYDSSNQQVNPDSGNVISNVIN